MAESFNLSQKLIGGVYALAVSSGLAATAWLFGSVLSLQNHITVMETATPYVGKQLDRIERSVGGVQTRQQDLELRLDRIEKALQDRPQQGNKP